MSNVFRDVSDKKTHFQMFIQIINDPFYKNQISFRFKFFIYYSE